MAAGGVTFGIAGALAAFPRRLAAREVKHHGGQLRRGITRRTAFVVFGRALLERRSEAQIEQLVDAARQSGAALLSEAGFLRRLGLAEASANASLSAQALRDQSGLTAHGIELLSLFDGFESHAEPYTFRDLILARKYAGLAAGGASWTAIARSVHRSGPVTSLTALSLHAENAQTIRARHGEHLAELDGQRLLPLDEPDDDALEEWFEAAESAEAEGRFDAAATLYARCLASDPGDSVAAFNRANCLRAAGRLDEAAHSFALAIKRDPGFVEAWYNDAMLLKARGRPAAARRHLKRAIALDPTYADPVYNLATLDYEAGDLAAARAGWARYLELDNSSEWAKLAARGIQYADLHLRKSAG